MDVIKEGNRPASAKLRVSVIWAVAIVLASVPCVRAQPALTPEMLEGRWHYRHNAVVKLACFSATLEFSKKDHKFISVSEFDKDGELGGIVIETEGTWKIEGNKVMIRYTQTVNGRGDGIARDWSLTYRILPQSGPALTTPGVARYKKEAP